MATSTQMVDEKIERFVDLDLIALICLLNLESTSESAAFHAAKPLVTAWQRDLTFYGPGTIDLKLEELASSASTRLELHSLLTAVDEKVVASGEEMLSHILNDQCNAPGVRFYDYPTLAIREAIKKLRRLIS